MKTTVAQLAESEGIAFQSANGFIKMLEHKGLAKRVDKVNFTKKGRKTIVYEIEDVFKVRLKQPAMTAVVAATEVKKKKVEKLKKEVDTLESCAIV